MIEVSCNYDFAQSKQVAQADRQALVLVFTSPSCAPCKVLKQRLKQDLERPDAGALFLEVNVEEAGLVAQQYAVRSVPTVVVADSGGGSHYQRTGQADTGELKRKIAEAARNS